MENKSGLMSARKASKLLGVAPATITIWFDAGKFPNAFAVESGKRRVIRIPLADVEALMSGGAA